MTPVHGSAEIIVARQECYCLDGKEGQKDISAILSCQ